MLYFLSFLHLCCCLPFTLSSTIIILWICLSMWYHFFSFSFILHTLYHFSNNPTYLQHNNHHNHYINNIFTYLFFHFRQADFSVLCVSQPPQRRTKLRFLVGASLSLCLGRAERRIPSPPRLFSDLTEIGFIFVAFLHFLSKVRGRLNPNEGD